MRVYDFTQARTTSCKDSKRKYNGFHTGFTQPRRAGGHNQKAGSHHASAWHCKLSIEDTLVFNALLLLRWITSTLERNEQAPLTSIVSCSSYCRFMVLTNSFRIYGANEAETGQLWPRCYFYSRNVALILWLWFRLY